MPIAYEVIHCVDMRNGFNCGVACVAMLTGLTPDEIGVRLGYSPAETCLPES